MSLQLSPPTIIHIVRRYGPVGGMENYVYELTQALARRQQSVQVWCEQNQVPDGVELPFRVVALGNAYHKPRWLAQWGFAQRVKAYLLDNQAILPVNRVIHSHERTSVHQVTTFHGPPFLHRKQRLLDILSPRIQMWSFLEKQELLAANVKAILPNSPLIASQLATLYPQAKDKLQAPAYPGVSERFTPHVAPHHNKCLTIGFLGREWKRKGLDVAVTIVEELRNTLPHVRFIVAGCQPQEVEHLFQSWPTGSYELLGWINDPLDLLNRVNLLLHPARAEPFGMVIAEANALGLPVVVSDACGAAALVGLEQGAVCSLPESSCADATAQLKVWVAACQQWLQAADPVPSMNLTWDNLASQHISLYETLL